MTHFYQGQDVCLHPRLLLEAVPAVIGYDQHDGAALEELKNRLIQEQNRQRKGRIEPIYVTTEG